MSWLMRYAGLRFKGSDMSETTINIYGGSNRILPDAEKGEHHG